MSPPRDSSAAPVLPQVDDEDPVDRAFRLAPTRCDEQITEEEREAVAAAAVGRWHDGAAVTAAIARRRPR